MIWLYVALGCFNLGGALRDLWHPSTLTVLQAIVAGALLAFAVREATAQTARGDEREAA